MPKSLVYGFFDLETQHLFADVEPKWKAFPWPKRQKETPKIAGQLKIALAGMLTISPNTQKVDFSFFAEDKIDKLVYSLNKLDLIIGYNLLEFDYFVLTPYTSPNVVEKLKQKTFDMLSSIKTKTGNVWPSLDDLAKLNLGRKKTQETLDIPRLWQQGKHKEVKEYLKNDLVITAELFSFGIVNGYLIYPHKEYGRFIENRRVDLDWERIIPAKNLPISFEQKNS